MTLRRRFGSRRHLLVGSLLLCFLAGGPTGASAQDEPTTKGLRLNLDEDGSRFLRFGTWVQIWARHTEMNPGSALLYRADRSSKKRPAAERWRNGKTWSLSSTSSCSTDRPVSADVR